MGAYKKTFVFIIILTFIIGFIPNNIIAVQNGDLSINVVYDGEMVRVTGVIPNGMVGQPVSLLIFYPGTDMNNIQNTDILEMNQATSYSNNLGQIAFDFNLFVMPLNAPVGTYTVRVSGNTLAPTIATFEKKAMEVMGEIAFTEQANSQAIFTNLNGKTAAYAKVAIEKRITDEINVWVGVALYDANNTLQKIEFQKKTLIDATTVINDVGITDISSLNGWYVKAFVWEDISTMKPLTASQKIAHILYKVDGLTLQALETRMWDAVIMKNGSNYAYVRNGKTWLDDTGSIVPYMQGQEALVPINFIGESLNSRVVMNETQQTATLYYMQYEYVFTMGSNIMDIVNPNGNVSNPVQMSTSAQKIGGVVYIPLSAFAEAAGFQYRVEEDGTIWFSHTNLFKAETGIDNTEVSKAINNMFSDGFVMNTTQSTYYVDPNNGEDTNDGTIAMPFRSIQHAKQVVRTQISEQGMSGDIIVYLRGGDYYFTEPILFDENDSGQNGYKVIYRAFEGEEPILNGGQRAEGWQAYNGNIYRTFVGTGKTFHTIFENAKFGVKARYPNEGYNNAVAYLETDNTISKTRFRFNEGDIPAITDTSSLEISKWDGGIGGHQRWFQDIHPVSSINYNDKVLTFIGNARYEVGTGTDYYIQGALELLDKPGEFYLSKDGYLYYWPNNLPIEEQNIVIPVSNGIINLKGRDENNVIRDISFEGITLRGTDRDGAMRFFAYDNAAIRMDNAAWISFDRIHAYNIASTVCYMGGTSGGWAQNNSFTNSKLHDIGKDGIVMEGLSALVSPQAKDEEQNNSIKNRYNVVLNNHIYNLGSVTGHTYPIGMLRSGYNYVAHNRIHDSTRHAICFVDWKPTIFGKTIDGIQINSQNENLHAYTRFNVFEFNDLSNNHTDSQDIAPVYSASTGKNNIIRNNLIYDNIMPISYGFAIYMDSGSHHTYVYDNVIFDNHNIEGKSELRDIIFSKGFNNVVFNNIAADNSTYGFHSSNPHVGVGPNAQRYGNPDQQYDNTVERNVVFNSSARYIYNPRRATGGAELLEVNRQENRFKAADYNLFYNTGGEYNIASLPFSSFASWRTWLGGKYDTQTIIGQDPVFMNPQGFDYRFKFDSPVYMQGIRDVNVKDAGLRIENPFRASTDVIDKVFIEVKDKPNNSFVDIKRGETAQLKVTARTENGYMVDMNGAEVQYSIDNSSIAEITNSGIITGKAKGVATLTATVTSNGAQSSTLFNILVDDAYDYGSFKLRLYDTGWEVGMSRPSSAVIKTELGRHIPISGYELTSSNPDIVKIEDNGFVTALAPGTATASVTYYLSGVRLSDSVSFTVDVENPVFHVQNFENKTFFPINEAPINNFYSHWGIEQAVTRYQTGTSGNRVLELRRSAFGSGWMGVDSFESIYPEESFRVEGYYRFLNPTGANPIYLGVVGDNNEVFRSRIDSSMRVDDYKNGSNQPITIISSINNNSYYGIRMRYYKINDSYWCDISVSNPISKDNTLEATNWSTPVSTKTNISSTSIKRVSLALIYNSADIPGGTTPTTVYLDNIKISKEQ